MLAYNGTAGAPSRTSGQQEPVYSSIRPYEDFPKQIVGQTVWEATALKEDPERWTYTFTAEEIATIDAAADKFIESDQPLTGMEKGYFPLGDLARKLQGWRSIILDGQGFLLLRGLPVERWGLEKSATAYMGLGSHLGHFVSQNGRGHVLGHVKDLGEDAKRTDKVRIYRTNARQFFHTDSADIVGLLCIAKAKEGGESDIISTHNLFNILQRDHPKVAKILCEPIWHWDRKGEVSEGQDPWIRGSVFYLENDAESPRVLAKFDPNNFTSLARFNSGLDARIPPLSEAQIEAMRVLEEVCLRESLFMVLAPGDIQFLSNSHILHARTAFKDHEPGALGAGGKPFPPRHLMRLWLSVPEDEGGWKLPYPDSHHKLRGGVQVNNTPPVCPLDAE